MKKYLFIASLIIIFSGIILFCVFPLPDVLFDAPFSTVVLDRNGELLGASIAADDQWRFPITANIPEKFIRAIVCFEDQRFFYHPGIDPFALARAIFQNIREGDIVSGASTLTMQVIRLSRKQPRTLKEKIIEAVLAIKLEWFKSKEDILSLYAAHAPFGGNVVGIEAASWRYFGRSPDRLSWAETAAMAVLPNSPALIHPGRNREKLKNKRDALLDRLHSKGIIDALSCRLAKTEPLPPQPHPLPMIAPHLVARIHQSAAKKGFPSHIRTTLIKSVQIRADDIIRRHHRQLAGNGIHNAAALIIEVQTGNVVAYVGNITDFSDNLHGNHVDIITAPRSTGSILKPLLYAAMIESGELLPTELVPDIPTRMGAFSPENYSRTYQGAVPAATALARSLNVPAVRMLYSYGVDRFHAFLKNLGMTTLHRSAREYGLSLILGGAEGTLWDITGIYAGIARAVSHSKNGTKIGFFPPNYIKCEAEKANCEKEIFNPSRFTLHPSSCWLAIEAMVEVARPEEDSGWQYFTSSKKIAWKTGTSYGFRDAWAVGITPKYAVGVWAGNADGEGRPGLVGISAAAPILFDLFGILDIGEWFKRPDYDLIDIQVCAKSGFRAGPNCEATKTILIPRSGLRARRCPYCKIIHCDNSKQWRVNADCENIADIRAEKWFILPPVIELYYRQKHSDYMVLPPFRQDCFEIQSEQRTASMTLIYPDNKGSAIYVPVELDGTRGRTVFEAAHRIPRTTIFWHLDEQYLGETSNIHQMALAPEPGEHRLTLVDENGYLLERKFSVLALINKK